MDQYARNWNRIADCVERRAAFLGRPPALADVVSQLSLRARIFRKNTASVEITSVRQILRRAIPTPSGLIIPGDVDHRDWIASSDAADLDEAIAGIMRSNPEIMDDGDRILAIDLARLGTRSGMHDRNEIIEMLAGKVRQDFRSGSPKDQRHLSYRDLNAIELELAEHDPVATLDSYRDPEARSDTRGLLRLFANAIWMSGMRPVEVWSSYLLVPRHDITFDDDMRRAVLSDPQSAVTSEMMFPVEQVARMTGQPDLGRAALDAWRQSGAPCILMIRSAKQTNANGVKSPYRLQVHPDVFPKNLSLLAYATQVRHLKLDSTRRDNVRSAMAKVLKVICASEPAMKDLNVNLYSFRHSFIARAKAIYGSHEAAALSGHSSRNSLYGYGQRNMARRKAGSMTGLPRPDPVRAAEIETYWSAEAHLRAEGKSHSHEPT